MDSAITTALIGAVSGLVIGILVNAPNWFFLGNKAKQQKAETAEILSQVSLSLLHPLRSEISVLRTLVKEMSIDMRSVISICRHMITGVYTLSAQLYEMGHTPRWKMDAEMAQLLSTIETRSNYYVGLAETTEQEPKEEKDEETSDSPNSKPKRKGGETNASN